jgi:hypothetical protein
MKIYLRLDFPAKIVSLTSASSLLGTLHFPPTSNLINPNLIPAPELSPLLIQTQ